MCWYLCGHISDQYQHILPKGQFIPYGAVIILIAIAAVAAAAVVAAIDLSIVIFVVYGMAGGSGGLMVPMNEMSRIALLCGHRL